MLIIEQRERPQDTPPRRSSRVKWRGGVVRYWHGAVLPIDRFWRQRGEIKLTRHGFSMIEIVAALVVLGILLASAGLPLRHWLDGMRVRSGLNRIAAEIYRARALGIEDGSGAYMVIESGSGGCAASVRVGPAAAPAAGVRAALDLPGVCIKHSGDSVLVFNSRGILKPPTRSFYASFGSETDSVLLSIAGRIRRSY